MGLTLAITTYNRDDMTYSAFEHVLNDDRIDEILIVDDCSDLIHFNKLLEAVEPMLDGKVRICQNQENKGCYHNKRMAIELASNDWVILFDSDNVMKPEYLDALNFEDPGADLTFTEAIYAPSFAKPHFDYRGFERKWISALNIKDFINQKNFDCLINTCNYVVNREEYLRVWVDHPEPWTADTLFMNYNWLKAGNSIYVVPGMEYEHLVHDGSHYKQNVQKTGNFYNEMMNKLKEL